MITFRLITLVVMLAWVGRCGAAQAPPGIVQPVAMAGMIAVSEPRVRLPANGLDQSAAYLTLTNQGTIPDRLVRADSPQARKLELHAHIQTGDGMLTMREIDYIDIPTNGSIALTPGDLHIMVKGIKPALKLGETMSIRLTFASGNTAQFQAPIVANPSALDQSLRKEAKGHQH